MATSAKDLKLWQEAVALGGEVIRTMRQHNRREVKCFGERIISAATDVGVRVADGYARYDVGEQRALFLEARRSLLELETSLAMARHADLIPAASLTQLMTRSANVSRLLVGYLGYLERQMETDRNAEERRQLSPRGAPAALTPT